MEENVSIIPSKEIPGLISFRMDWLGDCSHEIKRCLLLRRKVMSNLDSIFKSRDITLPTNRAAAPVGVFSRGTTRISGSLSCVTPWTVAHQAPLFMGFSRQEYWSGLPCPPPGDLPNPGTEPASLMSSALAGGFFTTSITWEACNGARVQFSSVTQLCPTLRPDGL